MHDIKWIRDNADAFDAALKRRGLGPLWRQRSNSIESGERRSIGCWRGAGRGAKLPRRKSASEESEG